LKLFGDELEEHIDSGRKAWLDLVPMATVMQCQIMKNADILKTTTGLRTID
jgi:hypothetical protein